MVSFFALFKYSMTTSNTEIPLCYIMKRLGEEEEEEEEEEDEEEEVEEKLRGRWRMKFSQI